MAKGKKTAAPVLLDNRGRFQAQGAGLELSESWAQSTHLSITDGRNKLTFLQGQCSPKQLRERTRGFTECRKCIDNAHSNGGIFVGSGMDPFFKSFPKGYKIRVDVEVRKGGAFV